MNIILASNNPGKIREFNALLNPFAITLIPQIEWGVEEVEETGLSFVENALIKARHVARLTGLPALADDSGLVVDALNGEPGIYSARYAGKQANAKDNIQKLLTQLKEIPDEKRQASFYCALVLLMNEQDPIPLICTGKWSGMILRAPAGDEGFGYDPIFYLPSMKKTAAEIPLAIKNKISHRGLAFKQLIDSLAEKIKGMQLS